MGKIFGLWLAVFLLAGLALGSASQYLITPIWPLNFIVGYYAIKYRRLLKGYFSVWLLVFTGVMAASIVFDKHQPIHIQLLMSSLCGIQINIFTAVYYWLIKNISKISYKRTALLTLPCLVSTIIAGLLFIFVPVDGVWYLMFFDYVLEQIATGFAVVCILYGMHEYKHIRLRDYAVVSVTLVAQYFISTNPLFYNCFILPLVNVYLTVNYHFKRFVFVMGLLSFICSVYLALPLAGQYWKENEIYLFSHLSTYRVGIALFIIVFLFLSELQMRHRGLLKYLEKVSFYDELTNLKNRRFLRERVFHSSSKGVQNGAVFLIDIDNFKKINDQYGHAAGDAVLEEMARILSNSMSHSPSHVFRWGGEEFLILVNKVESQQALEQLASCVIENSKSKIIYEEQELCFSVSMGVCLFERFDLVNYHKHIDLADQMLYLAKHRGKARYVMADQQVA